MKQVVLIRIPFALIPTDYGSNLIHPRSHAAFFPRAALYDLCPTRFTITRALAQISAGERERDAHADTRAGNMIFYPTPPGYPYHSFEESIQVYLCTSTVFLVAVRDKPCECDKGR